MSEKMTERNNAILINIAILAGLIWCYFRGYPLTAILLTGVFLLALANLLMYVKRRRTATH